MLPANLVRLSKFISLVLRHQPQKIGLTLDVAGWAEVAELLAKAQAHQVPLTREALNTIVAHNDKQRFIFSADGSKIRANHGHTLAIDLGLTPQTPPAVLYHGTARRFLASIQQQGLRAGRRDYVHLSSEVATAQHVGARHGEPIVLQVRAAALHATGEPFYCSASNIWLVKQVPPEFLIEVTH